MRNELVLGQSRQDNLETFLAFAKFARQFSRTGSAPEEAYRASMLQLFVSRSTQQKQDMGRNNASRMIAGPSPDLPPARPAASPTCLACQRRANNLVRCCKRYSPFAALQPHTAVVLVVHAFFEQASQTLLVASEAPSSYVKHLS
jgi:hypothetical protein